MSPLRFVCKFDIKEGYYVGCRLMFQVRKYLALDDARSRKYIIDWSSYVPGEIHSCISLFTVVHHS